MIIRRIPPSLLEVNDELDLISPPLLVPIRPLTPFVHNPSMLSRNEKLRERRSRGKPPSLRDLALVALTPRVIVDLAGWGCWLLDPTC